MSNPLASDAFDSRRRGYEEEYFRTQDAKLVDKLKAVFHRSLTKEELRQETGISNDEVLDRLVAINLRGDLLTAFRLYPLVEVAWADGSIDKRESDAVIEAAIRSGVPKDGAAMEALRAWLARGPTPDGRKAWYAFANELRTRLTKDELNQFRDELIGSAKRVARASGGILGIVGTVSPSEERALESLAKALTA